MQKRIIILIIIIKNIYFTARISPEMNIFIVIVCLPTLNVFFPRLLQGTGAVGCLVLSVARLSDWRSSAGWTTSQVPHTDHHHWWHTLLGCTSCDFAENAGPACLLFLLHSWHLADPGNTHCSHNIQKRTH